MKKAIMMGLLASLNLNAGILDVTEEQTAARNLAKRVGERAQESPEIKVIHDSKRKALEEVDTQIQAIQGQIDQLLTQKDNAQSLISNQIRDVEFRLKLTKERQKQDLHETLRPFMEEFERIKQSAPYKEKVGALIQDLRDYNKLWQSQKSQCRGLWDEIDSFDVGLRIGAKEKAIHTAHNEFTSAIQEQINAHQTHFFQTKGSTYSMLERSLYLKLHDLNEEYLSVSIQSELLTGPIKEQIHSLRNDTCAISKPFLEHIKDQISAIELEEIEKT